MKRLFLKWKNIVLALSMAMILLALPSCKSHEAVVQSGSAVVQNGSTVVVRADTIVVRDSVFVSEKMRGDTVYLTRVEWRDRWRTRMVHDTIVRTDSIVQVIDHPPRKYIPSFHKWSTVALWILIALSIVYLILRSKIHTFHL